ncbi:MAG: hypothetical protein AB7L41_12475 [Flavobacteriaceae bacterium]
MATGKHDARGIPAEAPVGGKIDADATAQTITSHAIREAVIAPEPVWLRKKKLLEMRIELDARRIAGGRDDLLPLLEEIDSAMNALNVEEEGERAGAPADPVADAPDTAPTARRPIVGGKFF